MTITRWAGRIVVKGKPLLVNRQPLSVQYQVQAVELYDQQGRRLSESRNILSPVFLPIIEENTKDGIYISPFTAIFQTALMPKRPLHFFPR